MRSYIDESGVFTIPQAGAVYTSCIGALVIPEFQETLIFENFKKLKGQWGNENKEFKGSKLDEDQISLVIDMLMETDCTFFASIIDMSLEKLPEIEHHKKMQASRFTKILDKMVHQSMKDDLIELEDRINRLSPPNYIQMQLLTSLVDKIQRSAILFYVQRYPEILGSFEWILDAKGKKLTEYEKVWQKVICSFLQVSSFENPALACKDFDYSYMNNFLINIPEYLQGQGKQISENHNDQGFDLKRIMKNTMFDNSENSLGLQLADILITTVRRACNGTLQERGWSNLGGLTVQKAVHEVSTFDLVTMSASQAATRPYYDFIQIINSGSKQMMI